jgi:hypothetical protein
MKTGNSEQIGQIAGFMRNDIFEIRSLKEMMNIGESFNGIFTVQIDDNNFESFCSDFSLLTGSELQKEDAVIYSDRISFLSTIILAILCIHLIVTLIVVYDFVKDAKSIAVEKLLGNKKSYIWGKRIFRLLRNQTVAVTAVFLLLSLIFLKATKTFAVVFLLKLALFGVIAIVSTVGFSLVTYYSISGVSIVGMLKNLRPLRSLNAVNTIAKIALMTGVLFLSQGALAEYNSIRGTYALQYAQWQETQDLYVLKARIADMREWLIEENIRKRVELYLALNKNGSILADFDAFTPNFQSANAEVPGIKFESARINPNYLIQFPVYDIEGNIVQIDEKTEDMVLLVPNIFKEEEAQIREYHHSIANGYLVKETLSGLKIADQQINIIWVKSDQNHFTYNLSVNHDKGNTISNVVLEVVTENNSIVYYYDVMMGYIGDPLKIRAAGNDPQAEIYEILRTHGYDSNVEAVVSVYDSVAQEIDEAHHLIGIALLAIVILVLCLAVIIIQSIHNYFDRHKRLISIRTFLGQSFWLKYSSYILHNIAATWIIIVVVTIIITYALIISSMIPSSGSLLMIPGLVVAETLASLLAILIIEKKKILSTLKGGN